MNPTLTNLRMLSLWDRARSDAVDLAASVVRRLAVEPAATGRLGARLEQARPRARELTPWLLECFAQVRPGAFFIQIGSRDAQQQDPLREVALRSGWRGIVVEPVPYVFARLERHYGSRPGITFANVAIGPEDREVILDVESPLVETSVPSLSFTSLCARHAVEAIDVLQTDAEGADAEILDGVPLERLQPKLIIYESVHLAPAERARCEQRLRFCGYDLLQSGLDTWCLNPGWLTDAEHAALYPLWRWIASTAAGLRPLAPTRALRKLAQIGRSRPEARDDAPRFPITESERRYLRQGYDDTVPLPPGAGERLSPENPRLQELRRAYAEQRSPAAIHHMWTPERVAAHVDLRWFRGDNLYQWHYPEHPRAMALKLLLYMRHLQARGGSELLERVSEDGTFGCWTVEVPDYGKISRDLLDSVSEIMFLERRLGILQRDGLRVLDVGAGYGRLAHRMGAVHPSLSDYACVDAVPESTFLAEFYLGFRACVPPARVVPLHRIADELRVGGFDLAVNVHSFSECTIAAIEWWARELARLRIPHLFVVPNEAEGIISRERGGGYHDAMPVLEAAGYRLTAVEKAIGDAGVRELARLNDNHMLFELETP